MAEKKTVNSQRGFYKRIKQLSVFDHNVLSEYLSQVDQKKVDALGDALAKYIQANLSSTIESRQDLSDYKTNPYVLLTSAKSMSWASLDSFAAFLFNSKLYAGLETSFGKSIETTLLSFYPSERAHWENPKEKELEAQKLSHLGQEEKARMRDISVWREIDRSLVMDKKRFLLLIKSGPHCINDTQVEAMKNAISQHFQEWFTQTKENYPHVEELHIIIGITYGTDATTNNKENQILVKLLEHGFVDTGDKKGTLQHGKLKQIKVYRAIGRNFWAIVGNPLEPEKNQHVFVEVLLGLLRALKKPEAKASLETIVNAKIKELSEAIKNLALPEKAIPDWMHKEFDENDLLVFVSAVLSFFDQRKT